MTTRPLTRRQAQALLDRLKWLVEEAEEAVRNLIIAPNGEGLAMPACGEHSIWDVLDRAGTLLGNVCDDLTEMELDKDA